jgi:hypothetical protein
LLQQFCLTYYHIGPSHLFPLFSDLVSAICSNFVSLILVKGGAKTGFIAWCVSFISENDIIPGVTPHPFPDSAAGYPVLPAQAMGGGTGLLVLGQDGCTQCWVAGWSGLQAGNVVIALHTPVFAAFI